MRKPRLGLIARADETGLGNQTLELYRHLAPHKTLVVDMAHLKGNTTHADWYPSARVVRALPDAPATILPDAVSDFLEDLDVVFTCEVPYSPVLYLRAARRGISTVCQYNFEFLNQNDPAPTLLAAPTMWHYEDVRSPQKALVPVPIATDRWPRLPRGPVAKNFLHVAGRPAIHDRNGTLDVMKALAHVTETVTVTFTCQEPGYLGSLIHDHHIRTPDNVTMVIQTADYPNYWDIYQGHQVLIQPRRFGGLCLPMQEAMGAGMPVVMPDISPNEYSLPPEWLVPATEVTRIGSAGNIAVYESSTKHIASLIDRFASDPGFYAESVESVEALAQERSWKVLKPLYDNLLSSMVQQEAV